MLNKKFGKKPARHSKDTIHLGDYKTSLDLAPVPAECTWSTEIKNPSMLGNDKFGDCADAGIAHNLQLVSTVNGPSEIDATVDQTLQLYSDQTGFDPSDPSTDQGSDLLDLLAYVKTNGFLGRKLLAYPKLDINNVNHIQIAIYYFQSCYFGIQLPIAFESLEDPGSIWDIPHTGQLTGDYAPGSAGGHCIVGVDYNSEYITFYSWSQFYKLTYAAWNAYVDEAYCLIWDNSIGPNGLNIKNLNLTQILADSALI